MNHSRFSETLYRAIAQAHRFLPQRLYLALGRLLSPQFAARVVPHLPAHALPAIVQGLPDQVSARIAPLLGPAVRQSLVTVLPIDTLVRISKALCAAGDYATAASFGKQMTLNQIKDAVIAQSDPDAFAHMAQYYDHETLRRYAECFTGPYLRRIVEALDRHRYREVELELGRTLKPEILSSLLCELEPDHGARFLARCAEGRMADLLSRVPSIRRQPLAEAIRRAGRQGGGP